MTSQSDWLAGLRLAFTEAVDAGHLDRDVALIERSVEGLARGEVKVVVDARQELADERCLAIIGPMVSENASPGTLSNEAVLYRRCRGAVLPIGSGDCRKSSAPSISVAASSDRRYRPRLLKESTRLPV
ncbi:hypothetical protein [Williamsia muralis]|uniref:hypothetical protein n=1 Tax=Williamsia marianensis TaxID=85044 RepID=UPI0007876450|nr:hypothetical protein [Williamsia muralis]